MRILHILKKDLNKTEKQIIEEQTKFNDVKIMDLRTYKDYERIIDLMETSDRIVCW